MKFYENLSGRIRCVPYSVKEAGLGNDQSALTVARLWMGGVTPSVRLTPLGRAQRNWLFLCAIMESWNI
jgi:hypothetical protein